MTFKDSPSKKIQPPLAGPGGAGSKLFDRSLLGSLSIGAVPPKWPARSRDAGTILQELRSGFGESGGTPLIYTLAPVAVFGGAQPGKDEPTGIGRNYDGHRMVWTPERGYELFTSRPALRGVMNRIEDFGQTGSDVRKPVMLTEDIQRFKRDTLEAAGRDPAVHAFVEKNRAAMQLDAK